MQSQAQTLSITMCAQLPSIEESPSIAVAKVISWSSPLSLHTSLILLFLHHPEPQFHL